MSADNYLYITKRKPYKVWMCTASCLAGEVKGNEIIVTKKDLQKQKDYLIGEYKTLKGAIKAAERYQETHLVEYGISFELWCG